MSTFENRRWIIINADDVENVNFDQVLESSPETLRYSVDGTKTFIKYNIVNVPENIVKTNINPETGEEETITISAGVYGRPDIYQDGMTEYTHAEILEILSSEEWTEPRDL